MSLYSLVIVRTIVNRGKKDGRPNSSLSREHSVALGGHVGRPCLWRGFQLTWRARGGEGARVLAAWNFVYEMGLCGSPLCVCVCLLLWRRIYLAFIWVYSLVLISIWRHNRQSLCHTMPFSTSRVGQTRRGSKWLSCEVGVKCIKGRVRGKESGGQDARCEGMLGMRNSRFYSEVWPYSYTGFFLSLSRVPAYRGVWKCLFSRSLMVVAQRMFLLVCYGSHARNCKIVVRERGSAKFGCIVL